MCAPFLCCASVNMLLLLRIKLCSVQFILIGWRAADVWKIWSLRSYTYPPHKYRKSTQRVLSQHSLAVET